MALAGTLDVETRPAFADYVGETLRTRSSARALILDLTELAAVSHGGLRALRHARRHVERRGVRVVLVAEPGSDVAHALAASSDPAVRVFDTRRAAIAATEPASRTSA